MHTDTSSQIKSYAEMGRGSARQWFEDNKFAANSICFYSKYSITFLIQGSWRVLLFFFFALRKPKIASFENMYSVITTSSFSSISGSKLFSCRIIVNMYKIGKTSAWLRNIFWFCFSSVPPETTINLRSTIQKSLFSNCNHFCDRTQG